MTAPAHISLALQEPNQIAEHAPWSMDFRQMSSGSGQTDVDVRFGQSITALSLEIESRVHQTGESPPGVITLGVPKPGTIRKWLGADVPEQAMILFGTGQEFDGVSEPGFRGVTVSIRKCRLEALAEDFGLDPPERLSKKGVLNLNGLPRSAQMFVRKSTQLLDLPEGIPTQDLEDDIGLSLLLTNASRAVRERVASPRLRDRVLGRALGIVEASPDDPPSIRELCLQSGASWPTLHRAFVERFGVGPKAYLTRLRLNRVRTDLVQAPAGTRVADVANRWGFWHMGKLAGDYHKLFNRLPSEDLQSAGRPG